MYFLPNSFPFSFAFAPLVVSISLCSHLPLVLTTPLHLSPALLYSKALLSSTWKTLAFLGSCAISLTDLWFFNKISFLLPSVPSDGRTVREQHTRTPCRDPPNWCPSLQTPSLALLLA